MNVGGPSRTAEIAAIERALHQLVDEEPRIFVDPIAPRIVDRDSELYARFFAKPDEPVSREMRSRMVMRSRYAEDCLAEAVSRGVRQYLILGAGLDTFAYRQPSWAQGLHIYEVDHRATQQWKMERLAAAGIIAPPNLDFAPIDFESMSLDDGLCAGGFGFAAQTFCSWLGVAYYLTERAIDKTFEFVRRLPSGSEIVFEYALALEALSSDEAKRMARIEAQRMAQGEPTLSRFTPAQLETKLRGMEFSKVIHFTPEDAQERYFKGRRDGLAAVRTLRLMRAIV